MRPDDGTRALGHLLRAVEHLALAAAAGARALGARGGALERVRAALREEERRWAGRAAHDPAAERVREVFEALVSVLEPVEPERERAPDDAQAARDLRGRDANAQARFDRPRVRWDTRARWRS